MDGLQQVRLLDAVAAREVGDGAGDFQDAVVGAGGQRELLHRLLEHFPERGVERDMGADLGVAHAGVGGELGPRETCELAFTCGLYPRTDDSGAFPRLVVLQLADGQRRGLDVDVDAVKQRAADACSVFDDL